MLGGQDQNAGDGATAIQGGRDVSVVNHKGMSLDDVRGIADIFMGMHLPMLREAAREEASKQAKEFVEVFLSKEDNLDKLLQKLSRPGEQQFFADVTLKAATRGPELDVSLLAAAVRDRLEAADDDVKRYIAEQAASALPRINGEHVAFLLLAFVLSSVAWQGGSDMAQLEGFYRGIRPAYARSLTMSLTNTEYLESLGLVTVNHLADADAFEAIMKGKYAYFDLAALQSRPESFVALTELYKVYKEKFLPQVLPTAAGKYIGALQLRNVIGHFDMGIFFK